MNRLARLEADYRKHALDHGEATQNGNHRKANSAHKKLVQAYVALRHQGEEGDLVIVDLLRDPAASVRLWAATHALPIDERKAIRVLKEFAKSDDFLAFDAQMVLSEWSRGALVLPG